jgi:CrcB protein
MKQFLLVFLGGGLGSMLRYAIGSWMAHSKAGVPLGTMTVNVVGSLLIGLVLGWALKFPSTSPTLVLLLATGFCGGFTTFSAFAFENYELLKNGNYLYFGMYTGLSLALGILAVLIGIWLTRYF